jgi:putative ABC transport system ATP-binding protein
MLEFRNVRKTFTQGRRQVTALNGVSLRIEAGEFVAIMGPSGSGKSTLLHLAAGFDTPSDGEVVFDGRALHTLNDDELTLLRRGQIGFVFQQFNLVPTLTVLENAALPLLLSGGRLSDVRSKVEALIERVGLKDRITHFPEELSGGEMQRVAVVRALVADPPVLLADEPTGNLDSVTGKEILSTLRELGSKRTLVMVTHDPQAAAFAGRTVRLRDGRVE